MTEEAEETEAMRVLLRGMDYLDIETYSMPADSAGDHVNLPLLGIVGLLLGEQPDPDVCAAARADFSAFLRVYEAACCRLVLGAIWEDMSTLALPSTVDWSTSGVSTRTFVHTSQRVLCDNISAVWADAMCELQELVQLQPAPFVGGVQFKVVQLNLANHPDPVQACFNWLQEMLTYAKSVINRPREASASNGGPAPWQPPAGAVANGSLGSVPPAHQQQQQQQLFAQAARSGLPPGPGAVGVLGGPGAVAAGWQGVHPAFPAAPRLGHAPLGPVGAEAAGGVPGTGGGEAGWLPPQPVYPPQQQQLLGQQAAAALSPRSQAARLVGPLGTMPGRNSPARPAQQPQSAAEAVYQPLHPVLPPQHYGHAPWHYGHPSHAPPMHMQPVYDPSLAPVAPLGSYGVPPAAGMQGVLPIANRSFPYRGQYPVQGSNSALGGTPGRGGRGQWGRSNRGRG